MSDFLKYKFDIKLDYSEFKLNVAIKQLRSLKVSPFLLEEKNTSLITGSFIFNFI